mmetsp:Transcript_16034/g.20291  ORF Transcript_16034/g.20291 Transcript_16034/m.20291 type:complete len:208 (-) Transcript_16034:565-1188(-)
MCLTSPKLAAPHSNRSPSRHPAVAAAVTRTTRRRRSSRAPSHLPSLLRAPMCLGTMFLVLKALRRVSRRQSSSPSSSPSSLTMFASRGVASSFTDPQALVSRSWPRPARLSAKVPSSLSHLLTWSPSGWVSLSALLSSCSRWRETRSLRLFSLMRLTPFAVSVPRVRTIRREESRLSSSFKCRVWATAWTVCSSSVPLTSPGSSIRP